MRELAQALAAGCHIGCFEHHLNFAGRAGPAFQTMLQSTVRASVRQTSATFTFVKETRPFQLFMQSLRNGESETWAIVDKRITAGRRGADPYAIGCGTPRGTDRTSACRLGKNCSGLQSRAGRPPAAARGAGVQDTAQRVHDVCYPATG